MLMWRSYLSKLTVFGGLKEMFLLKNLISVIKNGKALCAGLNELGKIAAEYGLRLVYHHHMGTGVQTLAEIDRLMEGTDAKSCSSFI